MKFNVDLSEIIDEFQLDSNTSQAMTKKVLDDVTAMVLFNWQQQAKKSLKSSLNVYLQNLKWVETGRLQNTLILTGQLPNMIESGVQPFDMKEGFRNSSKVKFSKDGKWYLTIPFRWGVPSSGGFSSAFTNILPQQVFQKLQTVQPRTTTFGSQVTSGQSINSSSLSQQFQIRRTRAQVINQSTGQVFQQYKHKNSIYDGISKNQKTYENATQNTYTSFRRVGERSDPNAFIHTGIKEHNLSGLAFKMTDFDKIVDNSIDNFLNSNNLL